MRKIITMTLLASLITFALFAFMAFLIHNDNVVIEKPQPPVQIFAHKAPEPSKPKPPKPLPEKPKMEEIPEPIKASEISEGGELTIGFGGIDIVEPKFKLSKFEQKVSREAQPIFRVDPKYPSKASRQGIEGWVQLSFDINDLGEVINIEVVNSQPKRIFDRAAKRALAKWKYKAKMEEGAYVMQQGLSVQLDFKMEQAG